MTEISKPIPALGMVTLPTGIRRFENPKTQAALDLGIAEMGPNDPVAVIVHHVYDVDGNKVENVTKASIVVRTGAGVSLMVGAYKDWTKASYGVEGKLVWKPF
jgi:hypothetical protein